MGVLQNLENTIGGWFKGAPKMSDSSKESLVKVWPWLALIGGILQALAALNMFRWANAADDYYDAANDFYRAIGASEVVQSRFTIWLWVSVAVIAVEAVLLLMAYPKLKKREKSGWDLLFLVALINVAYGVVSLFSDYYGGIGALIWNLVISGVVFWLLFATREKYKGGHSTPTTPAAPSE
jgi:hypothetical protein